MPTQGRCTQGKCSILTLLTVTDILDTLCPCLSTGTQFLLISRTRLLFTTPLTHPHKLLHKLLHKHLHKHLHHHSCIRRAKNSIL